jgi:hypothetical protein
MAIDRQDVLEVVARLAASESSAAREEALKIAHRYREIVLKPPVEPGSELSVALAGAVLP